MRAAGMPKFVVTETLPCWVDFRHVVEAESEEDAKELFRSGESDSVNTDIGDVLDWVPPKPLIVRPK